MKPQKKTAAETRREVLQLLQTEGLHAAADAAIAVCRDPNAPPNARATASGLILRATALGGFGKSNEAEEHERKELHMMTAAEIQEELARLRGEAADRDRERREYAEADEEPSAFD